MTDIQQTRIALVGDEEKKIWAEWQERTSDPGMADRIVLAYRQKPVLDGKPICWPLAPLFKAPTH
jgi:hypothetical protein